MIRQKREPFLHCRLDPNDPPINASGVVKLSCIFVAFEIVSILDRHLSEVSGQSVIEGRILFRVSNTQTFDNTGHFFTASGLAMPVILRA